MKYWFTIIIILLFSLTSNAQELNVKLNINFQKIESANKDLFTQLENAINQLFNETKWTDVNLSKRERIDANVSIAINEKITDNSFLADIQITVRRPVYNSSYITPLINYRDTQFEFSYLPGQSLELSNMNVDNNLIAVIAFYAYIILGIDFDSFSLNGGYPYFSKAMEIANMAQGLNVKGWEAFSGKGISRYDLAVALTDESSSGFHNMWYTYHRMGLDEMAANPSRGRIRIIESIADLKKVYDNRPSSPLLTIFSETKLDELVRVCSQATTEEKQDMRKMLLQIFPTKSDIINTLK